VDEALAAVRAADGPGTPGAPLPAGLLAAAAFRVGPQEGSVR
jgi:hypothetical protein